jgi:hypothetical protein
MATVRFRLLLQTLGIGSVDVRRLVTTMEAMRDQLRHLSQAVPIPTT